MGQSISSVVENLQQNAEKEKLANDAMNSLIDLAVRNIIVDLHILLTKCRKCKSKHSS